MFTYLMLRYAHYDTQGTPCKKLLNAQYHIPKKCFT